MSTVFTTEVRASSTPQSKCTWPCPKPWPCSELDVKICVTSHAMIPTAWCRRYWSERSARTRRKAGNQLRWSQAGTVNTGSIDPLREIAAIAQSHDLWMHVDGAYGALAAIAAPEKFDGLALADSLSLDPHKWLYQPLDCGCLLYRDVGSAQSTFTHRATMPNNSALIGLRASRFSKSPSSFPAASAP